MAQEKSTQGEGRGTLGSGTLSSGTLGAFKLIVFLALIITAVAFSFGNLIVPGSIGIRQIMFGPSKGFVAQALLPGYQWSVPLYTELHLIPQTLQPIHFLRETTVDGSKPLEVYTQDKTTVDVDTTVLASFFGAAGEDRETGLQHGGPLDLLTNIGVTSSDWLNNIRKVAADELKQALGNLSTTEFYDPFKRESQVDKALKQMNVRLMPHGVKVEAVLLRRYTYRDQRIEDAIFNKNIQQQEKRLNEARSQYAEKEAELTQITAEKDADIETMRVSGENDARVVRSQGALYETRKRADGDLLVAKAIAEVDKLKASALSQSEGADVYVAREMTPLLGSLKGGVVTDLDPYDLDAWAKRLGVR